MVVVLVASDWCSAQRQVNEAFQLQDEFLSRMSSHEALRMAGRTSRKCLGAETGCWESGSEIQRQIDHQMHHFTTPRAGALSPIRCNGVRHIRACRVTFARGRGPGRRISTIGHGKCRLGHGKGRIRMNTTSVKPTSDGRVGRDESCQLFPASH